MALAGKPDEWFVLPDPKLRGQANLVSVTSQSGPFPGPVSAVAGNKGLVYPLQSGEPSASAVPIRYAISQSGGPGVGEFGWRKLTDATDQFRGQDDVRRFYGHHAPFVTAPGSDNCGSAFSLAYRRLVVCNIDDATNIVLIRYRSIDTEQYDTWTETSFVLTNSVAAGHHSAAMIDLPDGRLMLVVRVGTNDFDVYHSEDGGLVWKLVSDSIIDKFNTNGVAMPTHDLNTQFKLARSGEFIRLVWMSAAGAVRTFLSTDRGISWQRLTDGLGGATTAFTTGHTDDPYLFTVFPVDDAGTFLLAVATSATVYTHQYAQADGGWLFLTLGAINSPQNIKAIAGVRTPQYLWLYVYYSDTAAGTNDGYQIRRVRPAKFLDFNNLSAIGWENLNEAQRFDSGIRYAPGRWTAIWAGERVFHYGARRDSTATYTDINLPLAWFHGGWTRRSLWRNRGSKALQDLTTPMYGRFWTVECDEPNVPATSPWTVVGTGTASTSMEEVAISSTLGNLRYYSRVIAAAGGPAWGHTGGDACFGWRGKLDTGDGSLTADEVAVRIQSESTDNTTRLDVSIRMAPTGTRIRDNNAAANLQDLAITLDTGPAGKYFEFRLAMGRTGVGLYAIQLAILDTSTGVWLVGAVVNLTTALVGGTNEIRWGNPVAPAAGTTRSYWREFWVCEAGSGHQISFVNPTSLLGFPLTPDPPVYVENGLQVQWGGLGGALTDTFDGTIEYSHGAAKIAMDSPRLDWRSTSIASQTIILDADPATGIHRWVHDAIGLFGCNDRTVTVDYDTDVAFGSPTAAQVVDFTAFNTGTVPLVVLLPAGTSLAVLPAATHRYVKGELLGHYVRVTSGGAVGATWKITRHDAEDVLYFEEETTSLSAQGLGVADTFVVFSPNAVFSYSAPVNERYMRLRFLGTDTAEGDHRCGTVVVGSRQNVQVKLDWAQTVNDQPNITQYRTKGALQWAYEEGPPQRTWQARMVGDYTARMRDKLRGLLRSIGFEARPIAWVFDAERPVEASALVRYTGGNQQDNAGFYRDSNDVIRAAGDLSITLVEEV